MKREAEVYNSWEEARWTGIIIPVLSRPLWSKGTIFPVFSSPPTNKL